MFFFPKKLPIERPSKFVQGYINYTKIVKRLERGDLEGHRIRRLIYIFFYSKLLLFFPAMQKSLAPSRAGGRSWRPSRWSTPRCRARPAPAVHRRRLLPLLRQLGRPFWRRRWLPRLATIGRSERTMEFNQESQRLFVRMGGDELCRDSALTPRPNGRPKA